MYFYEGLVDSPAMVQLQAKHLQRCLECLAEIFGGRDWELIAQAALWATSGSITLSLNASIPVYMQRCCEAVNNAGLRFIPPYGRPPFFSEELRERLSVLSQIIYFENFLILTSYQTWQPTRTARIEKEFRYQLQVRPATVSPLLVHVPQCALIGSLPGVVQNMSVDHAYEGYFVGQGYSDHAHLSSDRWQVYLPSSPAPQTVNRR